MNIMDTLGPLLIIAVVLLAIHRVLDALANRNCPFCQRRAARSAVKCPWCHSDLTRSN